jgi:hypothetical protein
VARAHQPVRAREPAWADEVATAVARVGEELGLPLGPPGVASPRAEGSAGQAGAAAGATAGEQDGTADDHEFFWRSAAEDGPARPWRSLFR